MMVTAFVMPMVFKSAVRKYDTILVAVSTAVVIRVNTVSLTRCQRVAQRRRIPRYMQCDSGLNGL